MKILIKARTELGNVMEIGVNRGRITMKRVKDAKGKVVNDNLSRGDRLHFCGGRFILRKDKTTVGETFGNAKIIDILIS